MAEKTTQASVAFVAVEPAELNGIEGGNDTEGGLDPAHCSTGLPPWEQPGYHGPKITIFHPKNPNPLPTF